MNKDVFRTLRQMLMEELDLSRELSDKEILDVIDELILNQMKDVRLALKEKVQLRQELFYSVRKLDVLQELVDDETVTEIMVNGPDTIFVERDGRLIRWHKSFTSAEKLEDVIQQIVGKCNRVINESMPIVDARLENGSRVNAVIYPVALNGPILTIRRFPEHPITMEKLIALGSITQECADFLQKLVKARYSMVIGGGTGSGKTTFLAAMSEYIPKDERLITIEDNAELRIRGIDNLVRLEAKMANMEGAVSVTIRDLIKSALRMRPDRIIVGEVRGGEAMDMLDGLQESINVSHSSIQEIADSTESTAEAIQKQAVMCSDIQGNTDQAEQGIKEMIEASHKTNDNVKEGAGVVSELKEQAVNVADASQVTVDVIRSLTDKVEEVKTFVDSIINISNQTNLLALNASIEAARAGEAGKGFAVVADEIRQLSEQTKDASANITEIIQKLNEDTKRANDSIMTAAESVEKQNQLIDDTRDKFNAVGHAVEVLMGNIDVAEQSIQKILDATGVISDNITHLSATGEEVAASSTEGLRTADITVEKMSNCKKVLENIYLLAEDLKNSVENNENQ